MSDDSTNKLPDAVSFEERVFARFDSLDARMTSVETTLEAKAYDTKPIWERALAEILGTREDVANLARKVDVLGLDLIQMRADMRHVETRLDAVERKAS